MGREVMVACNTLRDEIEWAEKKHGIHRETIWLESQLHNVTDNLRDRVQEALDSFDDVDRVLLGYGNCGNAIHGLKAGDYELVIPRLDDCISLLFGAQSLREAYSDEYHSLYFTMGWMDEGHNINDEYARAEEKYGEEMANTIFGMMYAHYETMTFLDTGLYSVDELIKMTEDVRELLGLKVRVHPATLDFVELLVTGPWDEAHFVTVAPNETVPEMEFRSDRCL